MIKVFYDGKCGLCRREIDYYQRIAPAHVFEWIDITTDASALEHHGIAYDVGLKLLHSEDASGKIHVGMDSFLLIWDQMPRWRILAKITRVPFVYALAKMAYRGFAAWRFNRLAHCQMALQSARPQAGT